MSTTPYSPVEINEKFYKYQGIHVAIAAPALLDDEAYSSYKSQGFLAVADILNSIEVQQSLDHLMGIIHDRNTKAHVQFSKSQELLKDNLERELAVRKLAGFVEHHEQLRQIAEHPRILAIVERILGQKPKLVQDMALLKPPTGGGEKPWHQDMAYGPLAFHKAVVGVWIALDNATVENGCMQVIPRSHMEGAIPHYAMRDWQICDSNIPVERDIAVPLQSGGALFFHGLLFHGTPNNMSDKRRRALQFHYVGEEVTKMTPQEYKLIFTNEMTGAEC